MGGGGSEPNVLSCTPGPLDTQCRGKLRHLLQLWNSIFHAGMFLDSD